VTANRDVIGGEIRVVRDVELAAQQAVLEEAHTAMFTDGESPPLAPRISRRPRRPRHEAGQTNGQGVNGFGARWYVVAPSGRAITASSSGFPY
jgi:hypothetical protein